ncbi:hypothetical protein [Nonomuraea insulae]|uniref:Uncharacterized protein n=1 Tax=Nonomuraea insulae TaxID=1616787 RepID=A0ABW1CG86_9ACTN
MVENDKLLVQALVDAFLLLETAEAHEIDPDTAVRGMENIASSLLLMDPAGQQGVRAAMTELGDASGDLAYREFAQALPDMIGLAPEP